MMGNNIFCSEKKGDGVSQARRLDPILLPPDTTTTTITTIPTTSTEIKIPSNRPIDYPLLVCHQRYQTTSDGDPLLDQQNYDATIDLSQGVDYRAFGLLIHKTYGAILLHCTRKKKKPPHYQLPGGHVDADDFQKTIIVDFGSGTTTTNSPPPPPLLFTSKQLFLAARMGCAREIYEETSFDFRSDDAIDRLLPMILYDTKSINNNNNNNNNNNHSPVLINEYKHRIFFVAEVRDADFVKPPSSGSVRYATLPQEDYHCNVMLQLSVEHSGFRFVKSPSEVVQQLKFHSGGKVSQAVAMAYNI
jgi:8-oxo-dGTP pyrophosphatase MutT (NUDIX family)